MVVAQYPATAGQGVLIQLASPLGFTLLAQVDGDIVGRGQGVGVVLAQYPAAAGEGVLVELPGLLMVTQCAQASYGEVTGRKLLAALAELGQLVSWGAYDDGQPGLAQRYNVAALRAAHSGANDRPLGAHILGSMAEQAAHQGRPAEAVTLAETALTGARGLESPRLRAELCIRQAYALAANHDVAGCTAAISKARGHIEQLVTDTDPQWLYWVIPAWIIVEAGDSLLLLGQADQAAGMLDEGIALFDESFVRDRQIYLTHQADALARPGKQRDLDAAADRGIAAIELAESLDSALGVDLLRDLYHQMKPHAKVPAVRAFWSGRGVW